MALSEARFLEVEGNNGEYIEPVFAPNDVYYKGALLTYNANGQAAVPTDAAAQFPAGIVEGRFEGVGQDNAYSMGATAKRGRLFRGPVWLPFAGAAQTDVGEIFFIEDDNTLTQTAGSKTVGLVALDYKPGYLLFDLRNFDRIA